MKKKTTPLEATAAAATTATSSADSHTSNNNNNNNNTLRSSNNNNNKPTTPDNKDCQSCVRLVTELLQAPDSRPRQLLEALVGNTIGIHNKNINNNLASSKIQMTPVADGVEITLPILQPPPSMTVPRRWTRLVAPTTNSRIGDDPATTTTPILATSATNTASPSPPLSENNHYNDSSSPSPVVYKPETIKIECRPCDSVGPEQGARALILGPTPLSIVACTNRLTPNDKHEMSQVLVHELIHAYDVKLLHLQFQDCESMAYSEVRAAREAECASSCFSPSLLKQYCVKQKAIAATHNLFPQEGRNCVRTVFPHAYADTRPFTDNNNKHYYHHPPK